MIGNEKHILVTGGSRGIGSSICKRFAKEGYFVHINFKSDAAGAKQTADEIMNDDGQCDVIQFDVTDPQNIVNEIEKLELPKLDVLVNNAGISIDSLIYDLSDDDIELVLDTNFFSACFVFSACREILKTTGGTIISIGSIAGAKGKVGQAVYAVSKAMLIEWTASMAEREKDSGLKFYCLSPGPVMTDLISSTPWAKDPKAKKRIPMNRFIDPDEIGDMATALVRNGPLLKSGSNVFYDGGFLQTVKS